MTTTRPSTKLEEIENLPAATLLKLSFTELSALIREAERRADKLYLVADWLRGIKTEKSFRTALESKDGGQS